MAWEDEHLYGLEELEQMSKVELAMLLANLTHGDETADDQSRKGLMLAIMAQQQAKMIFEFGNLKRRADA